MSNVKIYWTHEDNEPIVIAYDRLEEKDGRFLLYNGSPSVQVGYLSLASVAAIIPEHQKELKNPTEYRVFLREKRDPITVFAHRVSSDETTIQFFAKSFDGFTQEWNEWLIDGIYIPLSEIIAVLPYSRLITREEQ